MADSTPKSYHSDPTLWLYTSLSSGSSQIVTATSRLETILKANKIPFQALDVATDEKARMLWGRRAGKKKLPGLVRMGLVVGDLEDVEEWNEYGEIKENLLPGANPAPISTPTPSTSNTPSKPSTAPAVPSEPATTSSKSSASNTTQPTNTSSADSAPAARAPPAGAGETTIATALRQAGFEAAKKANEAKLKSRSTPSVPAASKSSEVDSEAPQKLDNSALGAPPPSGATEAEEAVAPPTENTDKEKTTEAMGETSAETGAVEVPGTENATTESTTTLPLRPGDGEVIARHGSSDVVAASPEEIRALEEKTAIKEEPEKEAAAAGEEDATQADSRKVKFTGEDGEELPETETPVLKKKIPLTPFARSHPEQEDEDGDHDGDDGVEPLEKDRLHDKLPSMNNVPLTPFARSHPGNEEDEEDVGADRSGLQLPTFNIIPSTPFAATHPRDEENGDEDKEGHAPGIPEITTTESAAATATDKAEALPGTKTQEQEAGSGEKAVESVAD